MDFVDFPSLFLSTTIIIFSLSTTQKKYNFQELLLILRLLLGEYAEDALRLVGFIFIFILDDAARFTLAGAFSRGSL